MVIYAKQTYIYVLVKKIIKNIETIKNLDIK